MTIAPPAHLLLVTRGCGGGKRWGGRGGLGGGAIGRSNRAQVGKEMQVVTNYFVVQHRSRGGGVMKDLAGSSDPMWPERHLSEGMQHNEIKTQQ